MLHWQLRKGGADASDVNQCLAIQIEQRGKRWEWLVWAMDGKKPLDHRLIARSHESHEKPFRTRREAIGSAESWHNNWS